MALLEWVWPCWEKCAIVKVVFEVSYAQDTGPPLTSSFLQDVGLSGIPPAPDLPACHQAAQHDDNGLNL